MSKQIFSIIETLKIDGLNVCCVCELTYENSENSKSTSLLQTYYFFNCTFTGSRLDHRDVVPPSAPSPLQGWCLALGRFSPRSPMDPLKSLLWAGRGDAAPVPTCCARIWPGAGRSPRWLCAVATAACQDPGEESDM